MSILPYEQNHELKEGWLKTIEAIEKRCIRPFPVAIRQHKVYSKGSCSCEEITELVSMVRKHQKSYSKIHHRAILLILSLMKVSIVATLFLMKVTMQWALGFFIYYMAICFFGTILGLLDDTPMQNPIVFYMSLLMYTVVLLHDR